MSIRWKTVVSIVAVSFAGPVVAAEPPASVRQLLSEIVVADDGTTVQTTHVEIAVNNDAAARGEGQLPMPFVEGLERLKLVEGYTLKPDGRRIAVQPGAVRTQSVPGVPNLPEYTDRKQIVAIMPEVAGGDVLVANWRRTTQPLFANEFATTSMFQQNVPWDRVELTIRTPTEKPLHVEAHGPVLEQTREGDLNVYHWRFSAPAVADNASALSPLDRAPRLFASTFTGWPAFSRAYALLFQPATVVTPRIQALADEVTAGADNPREQARQLYGWVGKHVRWVAVYLGNGSFVPHGADAVLANGYEDCKDQVALFIALLRAKGIDAEPVAINLSPSYTLSDPVTYSAFNHVITYLPEWQLYADTTPGGAPLGTLPFAEYGKPLLHITAKGEAPSRMPVLSPAIATQRLHTSANLLADGTVTGNSRTDAAGPYATALRGVARTIEAQGAQRFAAAHLRSLGQIGHGQVTLSKNDPIGPDEHIDADFTLDAQPEWLDGGAFLLPTGLRLLARTGDQLIGMVQQRGVPVTEPTPCYAGRQDEELSLTLPSDMRPMRLPKDVTLDGGFFRYESRWQFAEHTITARRSLVSTFDQPLCNSLQRSETIPAMAAIRRDLDARVILEKAE